LANFVSDVLDQMDLSAIKAVYEKDFRGQPPYNPRMMTKLLLYGYCVGKLSERCAPNASKISNFEFPQQAFSLASGSLF
jgi:hypothetical protein